MSGFTFTTDVVMDRDGYTATRYIATNEGRHLHRLLAGGVLREATDEDRERLAKRERVSMSGSGAHWGDGEYVLKQADRLFVMADQFNLGHLELARRRMHEQDTAAARADLFARIDGARCPTCGR